MVIALHYCRKDRHLALALAEWLAEIGPFPNHDFLIFRDHRAANASFGGIDARSVKEIVITDDVANSWPASANHAFKKIAKHVQYSCKGVPFLYLEPDCVVLRASAFDEIESEYPFTGKPFLGDLIDHRGNKPGAVFVPHMSGVGVYPGNMTQFAGEVFYADEKTPWDIAAGPAIHSQAKQSELIFHVWNQNRQGLSPFNDWSDVEQKIFKRRPKCALFHSDKTGTLLGLLRERKNLGGGVDRHTSEVLTPKGERGATSQQQVVSGLETPPAEILLPASQPESSAESAWGGGKIYPATTHALIEDQTPWLNKNDSIAELRNLISRIHRFQTAPMTTHQVRSLLAEAGVIALPKKKRRKKKK